MRTNVLKLKRLFWPMFIVFACMFGICSAGTSLAAAAYGAVAVGCWFWWKEARDVPSPQSTPNYAAEGKTSPPKSFEQVQPTKDECECLEMPGNCPIHQPLVDSIAVSPQEQQPAVPNIHPLCPKCGGELERVTQGEHSMLNSYQFDAIKAGDYVCRNCPDNGRGKSGHAYFWDWELSVPPPASTPANPPKEGHSAPLGEQIGKEIYDCLISSLPQGRETFAKQVGEIILAAQQGIKSRWSRSEVGISSCVPNIDTQRLDKLEHILGKASQLVCREILGEQAYGFYTGNITFRQAIDKAMASNNPPAEE